MTPFMVSRWRSPVFQKWYPLKWHKSALIVLAFAITAQAKPAPAPQLPPLLKEVESLYTKSQTLSADFAQTTENAALLKTKKASGKILVKRPSKFRWETTKPDPNLFISDGSRFWYYTPPFDEGERGQVVEKEAAGNQSKMASTLLSGSFSMVRDMKVKTLSPSRFLLIPKKGTAGTVLQATIEVNPDSKIIQKVILEHQGGKSN